MHIKDQQRRAYINQICEQLGCTQDSCGNWKFPNSAAEDTFESLMDSYDIRDSEEADAAQAMFVEFGFSSEWVIAECSPAGWGLCHYANFERWSQKQSAEKLRNWSLTRREIVIDKPSVAILDMQPSKMPMWDSCRGMGGEIAKALKERGFMVRTNTGERPRVADITGFADGRRYEFDVASGASKTVGTEIHQAMDASQRNEKLKQELIRQYTNAAAYRLGRVAMTRLTREERNEAKKETKDYLARQLVLIGCSYSEAGDIIRELVEGLKNV